MLLEQASGILQISEALPPSFAKATEVLLTFILAASCRYAARINTVARTVTDSHFGNAFATGRTSPGLPAARRSILACTLARARMSRKPVKPTSEHFGLTDLEHDVL